MTHDDSDIGKCTDLLTSYKISEIIPGLGGDIGVGSLCLGLLYIFNTTLTIYWIRRQKVTNPKESIEGGTRYVMFPVYIPFMWASAISDLLVGLIVIFISYEIYKPNSWPTASAFATMWAIQHFVIEGIACMLLQYGCGMQATRRAGYGALLWSMFTFACWILATKYGGHAAVVTIVLWHTAIFIFYSIMWLTPDKFIFRRGALKRYARFWAIFRLFSIIASILIALSDADLVYDNYSDCFNVVGVLLTYVLFKPYVVYFALLADSIWWQGIYMPNPVSATISKSFYGRRNSEKPRNHPGAASSVGKIFESSSRYPHDMFSGNDTDLVSPLHGIEVGFDEAQILATQVDTLRSEGQVKLLNFAFLSLNKSQMLGAGSFSKVYRGKYRGTPVAIKLIFTVDLNPEIITRCCKEAQLLSQINHPNVVEIFGVSVFPPSLCLVLEICHYGSLSDVIRGKTLHGGKNGRHIRAPLPLTHADKMYLALGCARGLEALHSYSPTLCHRDVKSFNFLVDSQLNAKIADLELGGDDEEDPNFNSDNHQNISEHTEYLKRSPASFNSNLGSNISADDSDCSSGDNLVTHRTSLKSSHSRKSNRSSRSSGMKRVSKKLFSGNTNNDSFLCTWQAPEVLIRSPHTQASDIYSLGLVFWEIISGLVPFENTLIQEDVRTLVLSGKRPQMPPCPDNRYVDLIKRCWKSDWAARPDIKSVVATVTLCWEASVHRYLFSTTYLTNLPDIKRQYEMEERACGVTSTSTTRFSSLGRSSEHSYNRSSNIGRLPLSSEAARAVAYLQNEPRLQKLQQLADVDKSAYIIMTPNAPHLVLWVSKNIPKMLGYFHSDLVCGDLGCICGPSTDRFFFRSLLQDAGNAKSGHRLITFYRRDGSQFINSLHAFPIFAQFLQPRLVTSTDFVDNMKSQDTSQRTSATSLNSDPNRNSYIDVISRSLEAAKKNAIEGTDYDFNIKKTETDDERPTSDGMKTSSLTISTSVPQNSLLREESNSIVSATLQTENNIKLSSIIKNLERNNSSQFMDAEMERRHSKALSLDMENTFNASEIPNEVAYITLHFSVVQDLRS